MVNNITTLEQSRKLKALGMPQDEWPQMVYWRDSVEWGLEFFRRAPVIPGSYRAEVYATNPAMRDWYAAPDVLTALEWLAEEPRGWHWQKTFKGEKPWAAWRPDHAPYDRAHLGPYETASALLGAILEAVQG